MKICVRHSQTLMRVRNLQLYPISFVTRQMPLRFPCRRLSFPLVILLLIHHLSLYFTLTHTSLHRYWLSVTFGAFLTAGYSSVFMGMCYPCSKGVCEKQCEYRHYRTVMKPKLRLHLPQVSRLKYLKRSRQEDRPTSLTSSVTVC